MFSALFAWEGGGGGGGVDSCFKLGRVHIQPIEGTMRITIYLLFNKVYESSASTFAINDQLKGSKWKRRSG